MVELGGMKYRGSVCGSPNEAKLSAANAANVIMKPAVS